MMLCALQFPFMRQESISLKLQAHFVLSRDKEHLLISALLWLEMMVLRLFTELQLSLRKSRLKILRRGFD